MVCESCDAHCPVAPPLGCRAASHDGDDYLFCSDPLPWPAAGDACFAVGMSLVDIEEASENDWVTSQVESDSWIGASDIVEEGVWRWSNDGSQFWMGTATGSLVGEFAGWTSGQPAAPMADCAVLTEYGWDAIACASPRAYVCERN